MSDQPILTAETILATAIRNALAPVAGTYNNRPKVYWQLGEQGAPKPFIVAQPQTPIDRLDFIGSVGATVLITIKTLAESGAAARDLLALAGPLMNNLSYDGYRLKARYLRSPVIPPLEGTYQSAHMYRITIERG